MILCLSATSGPCLKELPASGAPWSSTMPPSLGRGRVTTRCGSVLFIETKRPIDLTDQSNIILILAKFRQNASFYFKMSIHSTLVFPDLVNPDNESGRSMNEFRQRASRILPEVPDRWLPTLVSAMFYRVLVNNSAVPYKNSLILQSKCILHISMNGYLILFA